MPTGPRPLAPERRLVEAAVLVRPEGDEEADARHHKHHAQHHLERDRLAANDAVEGDVHDKLDALERHEDARRRERERAKRHDRRDYERRHSADPNLALARRELFPVALAVGHRERLQVLADVDADAAHHVYDDAQRVAHLHWTAAKRAFDVTIGCTV